MFTTLFLVTVIAKAHSHVVPLIYAAPSAVSHQSRIDIKHSPSYLTAPLIYSPAIIPSHVKELTSETVLTPILNTDTVLTPIAMTFFHNIPLARALEHPISLDVIQNSFKKEESENVPQLKDDVEISTEKVIAETIMTENQVKDDRLDVQDSSETNTFEPAKLTSMEKESS